MENNVDYEAITEFEITALVFFRLGKNNNLNNSEYELVNKYLNSLKSISSTDVEIFNAVSDKRFFIEKYKYKNTEDFLNLSEIKISIKTELFKQNILLNEEQLNQLKEESVYLIVKMFKMKKYYSAKLNENSDIVVHIYESNKNDIKCFKNNHSVIPKPFRCIGKYSNKTFNFWYCEVCRKYLMKNKTYENNVKYFEGLNIKLIGRAEMPIIKSSISNAKKDIPEPPSVNPILLNRSSASIPIIIVYDNFALVSSNCISKKHDIIKSSLFTKQNYNTAMKVNSFLCKNCNIHYIQKNSYQYCVNKKYLNFQYKTYMEDMFSFNSADVDQAELQTNIEKMNVNDSLNVKEINLGDFLVRSTLMKCVNKNHQLSRIRASVSILTSNKGMIEEKFDASYCKECNKSFILESTYNRLKSLGHICCKVIEYNDLAQNYSTFSSWQKKSLLAMYGYNVNKTQGLTAAKRHKILDILIQNNVMSSYEIISHLEMLIRTRKHMKNMTDAREKWEDDIDYVQYYNKVDDSVKVKSIYARVKI